MIYRTLTFLLALFLLEVVTAPLDDYTQRREVRGQTEQKSEAVREDAPAPDGGIVNLKSNINITDLVLAVSEINNETYVIDGSVHPNEISIVTPGGGLGKEDVLSLFDTVLRLNGLAVVKSDGINKIVNSSDIKTLDTPVETEKQD